MANYEPPELCNMETMQLNGPHDGQQQQFKRAKFHPNDGQLSGKRAARSSHDA